MQPPPENGVPWSGTGNLRVLPPVPYWENLAAVFADDVITRQIQSLREQSDQRQNEFAASALPPPLASATALLDQVAKDGWVERRERLHCPNCGFELSGANAEAGVCPDCNEAYTHHGGIKREVVYVRNLAPARSVDWVIAIHGMNTTGAWQEAFTWHLGTTWGRAVPVAVYKYGIVIAGVILAFRRRRLRKSLRAKLAVLQAEARVQGFLGKPDVIAHSFGTWLIGHLLLEESNNEETDRLRFGRLILTGCILRPDFDWRAIKDAGLVEDVLNHYGASDRVVPCAHFTIFDSGPSGQRGFDGSEVLNVRAEGYGHSDLFSIDRYVRDGKSFQEHTGATGEYSHLEFNYSRYWKPFLTLPAAEFSYIPGQMCPSKEWKEWPWPFRGTIFPFVALPLLASFIVLLVIYTGCGLRNLSALLLILATVAAAGIAALLFWILLIWLWRKTSSVKI